MPQSCTLVSCQPAEINESLVAIMGGSKRSVSQLLRIRSRHWSWKYEKLPISQQTQATLHCAQWFWRKEQGGVRRRKKPRVRVGVGGSLWEAAERTREPRAECARVSNASGARSCGLPLAAQQCSSATRKRRFSHGLTCRSVRPVTALKKETHLDEADALCVLTKALAARVQVVFPALCVTCQFQCQVASSQQRTG